jgi:predicted RNA-binding protein with PUA-like domain
MKLKIVHNKLYFDIRELVKSIGIGLLVFSYLTNNESLGVAGLVGVGVVLMRSRDWI